MSESVGSRLKKIRLEKGLSIEDVHKKTKLRVDIIKAIEEDSLINVNPVYMRGFLKIYCSFLGAKPKDYIADYKEPKQQAISEKFNEGKEKVPALASAVSKLGVLKKVNWKLIIGILFTLVILFFVARGLFALGKFIASGSKRIFAAKQQQVRSNKASVVSLSTEKKDKKATQPSHQKEKPVIASIVRLVINPKEDCWAQVKLDGKIVCQRVLKKGRFESWEAKERIELSLGNAGVVALEVNGQPISSLGRKGQAVKNIIITREGLNISR